MDGISVQRIQLLSQPVYILSTEETFDVYLFYVQLSHMFSLVCG